MGAITVREPMRAPEAGTAKAGGTPMVCVECRRRHHEDCPGGTWCDCQHQPSPEDQGAQEAQAEPALSWIRQG